MSAFTDPPPQPTAHSGSSRRWRSLMVEIGAAALTSALAATVGMASPQLSIAAKTACVAVLGGTILAMTIAEIRRWRGQPLSPLLAGFLPEAKLFKHLNGLASLALAVLSLFPEPLWGFVIANGFYYLVSLDGLRGLFRHPLGQLTICLAPAAAAGLALLRGDFDQAASLFGAVALILSFSRLLAGQWSGIGFPYRFTYFLACALLALGAGLAGPAFLPLFAFEVFLALLFLMVLILRRNDGAPTQERAEAPEPHDPA